MCQDNSNIVPDLTKVQGGVNYSEVQAFEFHPSTEAAKITVCVKAEYNNGKICVHFPIVGPICFSVPVSIPGGASVKVCMESCGFRFGMPPFDGIKATVYLQGNPIWSGVIWGSC